MTRREEVTKYVLESVKISKTTYDIVSKFFNDMTDKEYHNFWLDVRDKKTNLSFIIPQEEKHDESVLFKWLNKLGVNPFQKLTYVDKDGLEYTSPKPTLVIYGTVKRAAQTQDKKVSIPVGNKINSLTGQPTGESLSAKFTLPEAFIHLGYGSRYVPNEFVNARGGDLGMAAALDKLLYTQGSASMEELRPYSTKNVTTKSLKAYFLASHLKSTL